MRKEALPWIAAASLMLLTAGFSSLAVANGGGGHGGGGGGHFGGGGHAFAGHGGYGAGWHGGGYHGGGYGGWHGGYGYRGGWGGYGWRGWRGGYYGRGWGWGWGWGGLGLGLYFAALPLYYDTFWADGVPYYYADGNYFAWDGNVGQYETVAPPPSVQRQAEALPADLIAYPKNGQTEAQQAADKEACRTWAARQSGFDPTQKTTPPGNATDSTGKRSDYMRAQAACLEGHGYSVE